MRRSSSAGSAYAVRAAERVLDILDVLQGAADGVSLAELASAADLPKSSAFRYLSTLEARGYVVRDEEAGRFRLGLGFLPSHARRVELLVARAKPVLIELRDRFGETINLGMLDGNRVIYLEIVESMKTMRMAARKGDHDALHSTALGKAIASTLTQEEVRAILAAEGMPALTAHTITDVETFLQAVESVGELGYAVDDGENLEDGRCVATPMPVMGVPAAISVSLPASRLRLDAVEGMAAELTTAAARIAREAGATDA